jgi:hypothetical protein
VFNFVGHSLTIYEYIFRIVCKHGYYDILMAFLDYIRNRKIPVPEMRVDILDTACDNYFGHIVKALLEYEGPNELINQDTVDSQIRKNMDKNIRNLLLEYKEKKNKYSISISNKILSETTCYNSSYEPKLVGNKRKSENNLNNDN